MARIEKLILSMVELFEEYAGEDGKKIKSDELKQLLDKELTNSELREKIHADDVTRAMEELDKNHDGELNFNEFSKCVATLARAYHKEKLKASKKSKGKE
ncbi:hypothetical protein NHX12_000848 [Muraenolepis orangiensis]|uniref:EF-hand domain-containing protein n=1 Tax=Muraenolepis orangiensis TaxID=630683 RepID=A0A9Q0E1Z5_9TELE|nr:hypothetical protein NHX12_000848 [Muraenolepis orangiensis]